MSFGFENLKISVQKNNNNTSLDTPYGIASPMTAGLKATRKPVGPAHSIEALVNNYKKNAERVDMLILRNTQGLHAPLRLSMEVNAAEKIGRLPFLPSSNVMRDVIFGYDEDIDFEDFLNTSEFREQMGQPHAVVEKSLNIL